MAAEKSALIDPSAKKAEMQSALAGKTKEQKAVVKYFYGFGGCLSKTMTDAEYDALVKSKLADANTRENALAKLGLHEDQVKEAKPVSFEGYCFDGEDILARRGSDALWRSSRYQVAWFFFSEDRVYAWRYSFDLLSGDTAEDTADSIYKEVSNFTVSPSDAEKEIVDKVTSSGKVSFRRAMVDATRFALIISGERFYCPIVLNDDTENDVRSMKIMLRDKKASK